MDSRERFLTVFDGGIPDRVPVYEQFWASTVERWHEEGLPAGVTPEDYFGIELVRIGGDFSLQFPEREVSRDAHARTYWDSEGVLRRDVLMDRRWTPQWLDYTIKSRADWEVHKDRMRFNPSRLVPAAIEAYARGRQQGKFVIYSGLGNFTPTWGKLGLVNTLMLMLNQPDLISEMLAAHTRVTIDVLEGYRQMGMTFDAAWLSDDLGFNKGPLIAPQLYRELVMPHHKALCDHFAGLGLKTILHSDGNVGPLIPDFIEAGFGALHPLEVKAGLDVRELKKQFGDRLVFFGNIDVRKLAGTKAEIEEEVASKVSVAKVGGGYVFHSDHSIADNVPMENYRFALEMLRRYGSYD
jgi:uroporphyrinogen decarboxylase